MNGTRDDSIYDGYVHAEYYNVYLPTLHRRPTNGHFAYGSIDPTRTVLVRCKGIRKSPHGRLDAAMITQELHVRSIDFHTTFLTLVEVLVPAERCEPPVLRDDDLLAARELVLRPTKSLDGMTSVWIPGGGGLLSVR